MHIIFTSGTNRFLYKLDVVSSLFYSVIVYDRNKDRIIIIMNMKYSI